MSPRTGRVVLGLAMAAAGGASLGLGFFRPWVLPPTVLGLSGPALAASLGLALLFPGVVLSVFSIRRAPEPAPIVPAHVAFVTRTPRPLPMPERPAMPARRASAPKPAEDPAMAKLDEEIRELTRQINKAGILLATGQLSRQGYASYVEDLKKKRGDLEASRVRIELHRVE
jgi:hypothetical protein